MSSDKNSENNIIDDNDLENFITKEEVLIVAQRATGDSEVKVLEYGFQDYSNIKLGFLGAHNNLNIVVQKKNAKTSEKLTVFVKSIPTDNKSQSDYLNSEGIFVKESSFYDKIIPWLTKDYKGEKWSPACYLVNKDAMIMEDLRIKGYKLLGNFFDDLVAIKSVLATVARFHSCSILTEARLSQESKNPALNDYYPGFFKEVVFTREGKGVRWCTAAAKVAASVAENLGYESSNIYKSFDRMYNLIKPSKTHRNVIGHGDLWSNNIMFDDSKPLRKCVLVDFQIIRYGPLVFDILQTLYINTTREFREKNENELLKFYHSIMENTIRSNDPTGIARIPKFEDIKAEYDDLRIYGVILASMYFPIALLDPQILQDRTANSEEYDNFIFGDRVDLTFDYMKKDEFYKKRVEEAITELVDISEKL